MNNTTTTAHNDQHARLYTVRRFYQDGRKSRVQKRHLTLEQAQEWCSDSETSSMTAKTPRGCGTGRFQPRNQAKWHQLQKHWFDGYEEEK